ncbi:DUF262 domain-containing HNH endonuclease family protein [Clostridium estertheticum]|uniref:DUF262 domain-containing protein n=1 Tax=Clostridium estertheticum TaxID=238834 RepID=UPI001C0CDC81|nr:DUF262 domain-containing protein [Clostridium estertheticum]MBU3217531.1 DUF262 domain-containing HNH endonuclease family protein [Clostridium estertheticum]WAG55237.1 DUF262 domain-containing HNH endonuclease family protein [Clostridium estertheticum]
MEKINPQFYNFDEFLQGRLFEIPEYQRAYSWTSKQRKDLFNDIKKLYSYPDFDEGTRNHFLATVVCCNKKRKEKYGTEIFEIFDIVDGQQRITTLIILLKAIHKKLLDLNDAKFKKEIIKLDDIFVKDSDNRLILIQNNHDSSLILRDYLLSGKEADRKKIKTKAEYNLLYAFSECQKFVEEWCENDDILELLILIKYRLCFVFHELQNESTVYTVFEVLNSRGLEVDWLDKCKSMLMGIAYEENSTDSTLNFLHKYWSLIYRTIGINEVPGSEILRFAATLYYTNDQSRVMKPEDAIECFRKITKQSTSKVVDISKWLLDVASELSEIYSNVRLTAVTDKIHARLVAVAIKLSEHFDENEKEILLQQWEKVTFRIFGLYQKDSRTKIGEYTRLAQKIMGINDNMTYIKEKGKFNEVFNELVKLGIDYPAAGISKALEDANCYNGWEKEAIYFFYNYERYLCGENGYNFPKAFWDKIWESSVQDSIEHIYPQTESLAWRGKVTKRKEYHANRIGNLLILPIGLNKQLQNNGFDIKKSKYSDTLMYSAKDVAKYNEWNIVTIEERTKKLLEWAQKEWEDIKL